MGYYIEVPENKGKARQIIELYGGRILPYAPTHEDARADEAIICVVDNGLFEAAGFAYDKAELESFKRPDHGYQRPRTWLIIDRKKAIKLTGFIERQ